MTQQRKEFVVTTPVETQIDEIVATCDGDLLGAVKALILVNERLEREIAQLQAEALRAPPLATEFAH